MEDVDLGDDADDGAIVWSCILMVDRSTSFRRPFCVVARCAGWMYRRVSLIAKDGEEEEERDDDADGGCVWNDPNC